MLNHSIAPAIKSGSAKAPGEEIATLPQGGTYRLARLLFPDWASRNVIAQER